MSDDKDESQRFALLVVSAIVAVVVGSVVAFGAYKGSHPGKPATVATAAQSEPEGRIYFDLGSAALPPEAGEALAKVAEAARSQADKRVSISGYHDASGDAATNAELAKQRALAVRDALAANGIAEDRLVMEKPVATTGGAEAREARRVEMRLR